MEQETEGQKRLCERTKFPSYSHFSASGVSCLWSAIVVGPVGAGRGAGDGGTEETGTEETLKGPSSLLMVLQSF